MIPLPIDAVLPDLLDVLRRQACAVLRAPTGAGKTTRVPPALLRAGAAFGWPEGVPFIALAVVAVVVRLVILVGERTAALGEGVAGGAPA